MAALGSSAKKLSIACSVTFLAVFDESNFFLRERRIKMRLAKKAPHGIVLHVADEKVAEVAAAGHVGGEGT
eukprot:CAMPEP_0177794002 /NCGR_PEP_ID=MMETSP0491_2-20121128/25396_1 /TAXON_ID=63592 /ORGANISM="Tetraselmis chuii, Strain PLY429" /LENGTH=70 /DNA_ID=CAMNT_0019316595 /DNA_START=148 /DNA_END=360 /DNA_ORIENTATION=-